MYFIIYSIKIKLLNEMMSEPIYSLETDSEASQQELCLRVSRNTLFVDDPQSIQTNFFLIVVVS